MEHFVCQVFFVLTCQVASPEDFIFELKLLFDDVFLKNSDCFGIGYSFERSLDNLPQSIKQPFLDSLLEEVHIIFVIFKHVFQTELEVVFSALHIILESGESQLWLNHPKLTQVSGSMGVLRPESWSKSINIR